MPKMNSLHSFLVTQVVAMILSGGLSNVTRAVLPIKITTVDTVTESGNTYQSHNQKVVRNAYGIFATYTYSNDLANDNACVWRLARSTDDGDSFSVIYEGTNNYGGAPAMETDATGNLYLTLADRIPAQYDHWPFLIFFAADGFQNPQITDLGAYQNGAKFCMTYDAYRNRFYVATQRGYFLTVDMNGSLVSAVQNLNTYGDNAATQYPILKMDENNDLHYGWTTAGINGNAMYYDIHHMYSPDGGATWRNMGGALLNLPTNPDDSGSTLLISLPDECTVSSWLCNMLPTQSKVHFLYFAYGGGMDRYHHVRYDIATGTREVDSYPESDHLQGDVYSVSNNSGLLASKAHPGSPLFVVSKTYPGGNQVVALRSDDNGETWQDHAIAASTFGTVYALGGSNLITNNQVIGTFTDEVSNTVHFFSFPVSIPEGDFDGNGMVDLEDLGTFCAAWLTNNREQ